MDVRPVADLDPLGTIHRPAFSFTEEGDVAGQVVYGCPVDLSANSAEVNEVWQHPTRSLVFLALAGPLFFAACGGDGTEGELRAACVEDFRQYALRTAVDPASGTARIAVQIAEPEEWAEVCWVSIRDDAAACTFFERRRTQQTHDAGFSCAAGSPTIARWTDFDLSGSRE